MDKGDRASIFLFLFVLAFAVILVDERWLRVAVAFVPALLLVQKALDAERRRVEAEVRVGMSDRRVDDGTRTAVDELLRHIREFYLTCHLMGMGKMSPDEAVEKSARQEQQLNRLLAQVTDGVRAVSVRKD